jgi:hypothetical protein
MNLSVIGEQLMGQMGICGRKQWIRSWIVKIGLGIGI